MGNIMWYEWNTLKEFKAWHTAICGELGFPIQSINQSTGMVDENSAMTESLTNATKVGTKWIAYVEAEHATGLNPTDLRIPKEPAFNEPID